MNGHSWRTATVEISPRLHNEDLAPAMVLDRAPRTAPVRTAAKVA
jgi:hypothetical protein